MKDENSRIVVEVGRSAETSYFRDFIRNKKSENRFSISMFFRISRVVRHVRYLCSTVFVAIGLQVYTAICDPTSHLPVVHKWREVIINRSLWIDNSLQNRKDRTDSVRRHSWRA
jgi:hypothetical protein